jgi:O-6-methylguanine DNA methyltransferase
MTDVFPTVLGRMEARWKGRKLASLKFSEQPRTDCTKPLATSIQAHLAGEPQDFSDLELCYQDVSPFAQQVYRAARAVPCGSTTTYGEISKSLSKPGASRAVGTALGHNPFLIIVPCHRVLASGGKLGGFSAPGGVRTKELMLASEGVGVESLWDSGELERATIHLKTCPRLGPVIDAVGACPLKPSFPKHPFASLARSILYQQLAGSAAAAIERRVIALGSDPFPTAQEFLQLSEERLRGAGVSGPKMATLKRLSRAVIDQQLQPDRLRYLPNSHVEEQISSVKGLGNWSARMFLLFHLGRRDVFPVKDLGIRKGVQLLFGTRDLPNPTFMERKSKPWRPYRSLASWYLWRSLEI